MKPLKQWIKIEFYKQDPLKVLCLILIKSLFKGLLILNKSSILVNYLHLTYIHMGNEQ
jgi:hypothetical protein